MNLKQFLDKHAPKKMTPAGRDAQTYQDKAGDRIFSGPSAEQNYTAAKAFAAGLRERVFTAPKFRRFISNDPRYDGVGHHPHAFQVWMSGNDAYVDQGVLIDFGAEDGNVYVNSRLGAYHTLLNSVARTHGYSVFD
jgi:hypothetical protein